MVKRKIGSRSMRNYKSFKELLEENELVVGYIFLGIGLALFVLNVSSLLSFLPREYSYIGFDLSVFSSILIIVFAVYIITLKKLSLHDS